MPQRPASADWHGQIVRYPRQTRVGPGEWHEGPEPLYTAGAGFYLWWRHEGAPVRFQRPRAPRWMLIGPFTTRAAAVRHRKAMDAAGGAGRPAQGRRAPAAMRIGKTVYEILDTTRVQTRRGAATLWKLRGPDGKEHKLERFDGRGQPYYKSSRWFRPHPIAAEEVRYLPATAGERPKPPRPAREPVARGIQTHIVSRGANEGGQHLVTVNPGAWVRLHGSREVWARHPRGGGGGTKLVPYYDLTFRLGDVAVNGSYNLTYTGIIESIGPKRILVVGVPVGRKSMDLRSFSAYNRDFDAERIARENADTMMRI